MRAIIDHVWRHPGQRRDGRGAGLRAGRAGGCRRQGRCRAERRQGRRHRRGRGSRGAGQAVHLRARSGGGQRLPLPRHFAERQGSGVPAELHDQPPVRPLRQRVGLERRRQWRRRYRGRSDRRLRRRRSAPSMSTSTRPITPIRAPTTSIIGSSSAPSAMRSGRRPSARIFAYTPEAGRHDAQARHLLRHQRRASDRRDRRSR